MFETVIKGYQSEFERFLGLLEKQIEICPEELWSRKIGEYPFSQHVLHSLACTFLYAARSGRPFEGLPYDPQVMMMAIPSGEIKKEEMKALAAEARTAALSFMAAQGPETLGLRHEVVSQALGRERSVNDALLSMIRHICYHLGCCDTVLREHGLPGVH